ncbi:MAG: type II secretion system protein N, partial [Gallionellaceae bacterium]|nr:type II secretion system protein N [Gallionellaceae bacterium]
MSKRAALLLFALTYLIVLCATAPASLLDVAVRRASDDRLALANASGTIWNGAALLSMRVQKKHLQPLQTVHWRIAPTSLFTGKLRAQLNSGEAAASSAQALISFNEIELRQAQFQLPAMALDEISPTLRPARFRGQLDFRTDRLTL